MSNGASDGYQRYYAEKLWQLVPEVYRNDDESGAFRQLVELIGEEVAESRRSIDRLWEDQHIETGDDWAVPYIGALVNTRLVSAEDRRARRVDVGNTIRYRRRRGTPDLLDTLARTMSGWDVILQEGFRRLARTRHRLEPPPRALGLYTTTYEGGFADLRNPVGAEIEDSPFDEYFHTLDVRLLRGRDGRHGIRKLNFYLYRLRAFEMNDVDPVELTDPDGLGFLRSFTVDPSGRDVPLFLRGEAGAIEDKSRLSRANPICTDPFEWQVTQAIRCRMLGHDAYRVTTSLILELESLPNPPLPSDNVALSLVSGIRFESETAMRRRLIDFGAAIGTTPPDWYVELVGLSLIDETGKAQLYPAQVAIASAAADFPVERISAGNLSDLRCHPEPAGAIAELLISPEQGRFASIPPDEPADFEPSVVRYHYGFSAELGAGPYPRPDIDITPLREAIDGVVPDGGLLQGDGLLISDNRSYDLTIEVGETLQDDAVITVGPQRRPFVRLQGAVGSETQAVLVPDATAQTFIFDGGWFAGQDPNGDIASGDTFDLVIDGAAGNTENEYDFERVEIRFATLDPGGVRADGATIPPLRIFVRSRIRRLVLRRAISGPIIVEKEDAADPSVIEELVICESIVDASQTSAGLAVSNAFGRVSLEGSTVFGDLYAAVLDASNSIVVGVVNVVNNQAGCFRFSATFSGADVRLPPRYRDYVGRIPPAFFNSSKFGDPQYAQLSIVAPDSITTGAENGSEMGAFSHLLNPIRLNSIRAKVNEYGPAGQLAQYLFEGDRSAEALYRLDALSPDPPVVEPPLPPTPGDPVPAPPPPPPPVLPTSCPDDPPPVVGLGMAKELTGNDDADGSGVVTEGDTLTYTLTATNTGTSSLTGVTISDPLPGLSALSCSQPQPASLGPSETLVCTATYQVTDADARNGRVTNTATADSDQTGPVTASQNVPVVRPGLNLVKELTAIGDADGSGDVSRGDTLTYTFTATNTGNSDLTGVTISDPLPGLSELSCSLPQPASLGPSETLVCRASYRVTNVDARAGIVTNTATADSDQTAPVTDSENVPVVVPEPVTSDPVVITLTDADLNGAPGFWRSVDWLPTTNTAIDPTAAALPGIPFDKVDFLVEYDARMGSVPEDQGWEASPAALAFFQLLPGTLAFGKTAPEPAFYSQTAELERDLPEQVHAHATVLITEAPGRATQDQGESFEIRFRISRDDNEAIGMRAGWSRGKNGGLFKYVTLDGSDRFAPTSIEPLNRLTNAWTSVSLQADLLDNRALMSHAGMVDHRPLDWFGRGRSPKAGLEVLFGFTRRRGRASGQLRNLVVSGPGRFMRSWLRSGAPSDAPVLRLGFITDAGARGSARITVRYDGDPGRQPFMLPAVRVDGTLVVNGAAPEQPEFIDLPLKRALQGQHLLLTVERDWTHGDDELRATLRLVSARILVNGEN